MAAGQLSLYGAQNLLGAVFGVAITPPANFYLALTTTLPTPSMTGAQLSEPSPAAGYLRLQIPNNTTNFSTQSNSPQVMNALNYSWPTGSATAAWATCVGWALCDAPTGGNVWVVGTLATPVTVPSGFQAVCSAGALSLELDPFYSVNVN